MTNCIWFNVKSNTWRDYSWEVLKSLSPSRSLNCKKMFYSRFFHPLFATHHIQTCFYPLNIFLESSTRLRISLLPNWLRSWFNKEGTPTALELANLVFVDFSRPNFISIVFILEEKIEFLLKLEPLKSWKICRKMNHYSFKIKSLTVL